MKTSSLLLLSVACVIFLGAASSAKAWAVHPGYPLMVLTLALYTVGNLLMLFLIRDVGMATAFSVSAVAQLIAVNLVAVLVFGERLGLVQGIGIVLAVVSVALVTLGPRFTA